ncbi:MAG: hypothetical protein KFH87_07490 [Bacteroidetes bacterium]|nr:hypothetical protein [Bacteroidota bacterium]
MNPSRQLPAALCCLFFLALPCSLSSQHCPQSRISADLSDNSALQRLLLEKSEGDQETLLEQFEEWQRHPIILSRASVPDISVLPFLTHDEARRLHALARDTAVTQQRIDAVLEDDADRLALLHACTCLHSISPAPPRLAITFRGRLQQEDQPRAGYLDGRYPGSRMRIQQRLRVEAGSHVTAGVLAEKDPGEQSLADHLAAFLAFDDIGPLRRVVLGDFAVSSGQGLVFWQRFGLSKGGEPARVARSADLLSPFVSATEGFAARGIATQLGSDSWDALIFYSGRGRNASIDSEHGTAGAFSIDGLHRTASEVARKNSVQERLLGGHFGVRMPVTGGTLSFGGSALGARYTPASRSRSPFGFEGDEAWLTGMDVRWTRERLTLFGEAAYCHTKVSAWLAGLEASLTPAVEMALLARHYHERFISLHGSAFGERDGIQNEQGVYFGMRLRPFRGFTLNMWVDLYRFPNRTYFVHLPSSGDEALCALEYRLCVGTMVRFRLRQIRKDQTIATQDAIGRDIRPIARRVNRGVRIELQHEGRNGARLRLRAEYQHTAYDLFLPTADGLLLSVDLRVRPLPRLSFLGRLTAYDTDSWDARLYQFEHDVRGVMRNAALYGDGLRGYLLMQWQTLPTVAVGMRYAVTIKDGLREMGNGADLIRGDRLGHVSIQLDAVF